MQKILKEQFREPIDKRVDIIGKIADFRGISSINDLKSSSMLDNMEVSKDDVYYILMQVATTIQVSKYQQDDDIAEIDLGQYMVDIVSEFVDRFEKITFDEIYYAPHTQSKIKKDQNPKSPAERISWIVSGGHPGIGSINNIPQYVFNIEIKFPPKKGKTDMMKGDTKFGKGYTLKDILSSRIIEDLSYGLPKNITEGIIKEEKYDITKDPRALVLLDYLWNEYSDDIGLADITVYDNLVNDTIYNVDSIGRDFHVFTDDEYRQTRYVNRHINLYKKTKIGKYIILD
jgi:hypothetical protein